MDGEMKEFQEDSALAEAVRGAFDVGQVPERLRSKIHLAAAAEWNAMRRRRRQRMHRWLSGLTSMAAAAVILMYSGTQYFGVPGARADKEQLRNLDRIMDLVSLSYPEEDLTDEELQAMDLATGADVTHDYIAARVDRMLCFDESGYFGE